MAKTIGPLLSFGARGKLAQTLTFQRALGLRRAVAYTQPTDPFTTAQLEQRAKVAYATAWWQLLSPAPPFADAWTTFKKVIRYPFSPYALHIRTALDAGRTNPLNAFVYIIQPFFGRAAIGFLSPACGSGPPTEPGNVQVWIGPTPTTTELYMEVPITDGFFLTGSLGAVGEVRTIMVMKGTQHRSPYFNITLAEFPP